MGTLPRHPPLAPPPAADEGQTTLFVGGLDTSVPDADIWAVFAHFGPVSAVKVMRDKGCGFVQVRWAMGMPKSAITLSDVWRWGS